MRYKAVLKLLGQLLALFSLTILPPILVSFYYGDGAYDAFFYSFLITLATGGSIWFLVRKDQKQVGLREGFLCVVGFWISIATAGMLPFLLSEQPDVGLTDAFFESMSGLTTTGATALVGLDELPRSILYYRQQLQWLGGMGIIVLAVAVMPMLGVGGMQLFQAETSTAGKHSKLTPRITETAKALWFLYVVLTIFCALAYLAAGMEPFDAIAHSFSTIAIGGFSPHDASFAYFQGSPQILFTCTILMIVAGINFGLHFLAWRSLSLSHYWRDTEVRVYLAIMLTSILIACTILIKMGPFTEVSEAIKHGLFQVVSFATTTGFTTVDYTQWPLLLPAMLLAISIIGGCAGSTAGGLKVIRVILLFKQGYRETLKLIHPNARFPIRLSNVRVSDSVANAIWGFFALYVLSFVCISLVLMLLGLDMISAYSTVTACLNNLGPALGMASFGYSELSDPQKWVLAFTMLLGRLELLTLLVLFTVRYWRD